MTKFQTQRKSFTLIEMLVVVVIIGILAVTLIPRLVGARERASDSARIVKVGQISSAVELYAQETGSPYPIATLTGAPGISVATPIVTNAITPYLSTIPTDPGKGTVAISTAPGGIQVTGDSFAYWTNTGGTIYAITALMESKKGNSTNGTGLIDREKEGGYQKVGKGLTTSIVAGGGGGSSYPTAPGVHYVSNNIVVTDGTNTYVIADRNVGATEVGTGVSSYGDHFQRGNNYGFSRSPVLYTPNSTTPVNTNGLTTYTSSIWIYAPSWNLPNGDWSSNQNDNLRSEKTQGPCPSGYHIPTYDEWKGLVNTRASLTGKTTYKSDGYAEFNADLFSNDLKLPKAGYRDYDSAGSVGRQGDRGYYWSSTPCGAYAYLLYFYSSGVGADGSSTRAYGFSMRCFENSY